VGHVRPRLLTAACLAVSAAALAAASTATAQPNPPPCQPYTPVNGSCTQVSGPWVTTPAEGDNEYPLNCPSNTRAVNASAEFPYGVWPLGIEVGGGLRPGVVTGFFFTAIATQVSVTYQPWIACVPSGPINFPQFRGQGDTTAGSFRIHVRTKRIRPKRHVRVRLGCRRGQRLMDSGSAVAFFTRRPPSRHVVKAIEHRHRRTRSGTRTDVAAPVGVGDNERVELTVTTFCLP
jgi:hypothetical protein